MKGLRGGISMILEPVTIGKYPGCQEKKMSGVLLPS